VDFRTEASEMMVGIRMKRSVICPVRTTALRITRGVHAEAGSGEEQTFLGYKRHRFIQIAESACPFIRDMLGATVTSLEAGKMTWLLPYKPDFVGNPVNKVLHGGVTAALIDHVGGLCAMSCVPDANFLLSTVDLRIDYINPARPEAMICEAHVTSRNKTLIRSDITAWNADKTRKIATGRALYSL
jgi:uncharacterized protein (TIGR00369 family)